MNSPLLLLFTLFLLTSPLPTTDSLPFPTYQIIFSVSHSLLTRVATLRQSRGDHRGSTRAKAIAKELEPWRLTWSVGLDYLPNYEWRNMSTSEMFELVSDIGELMRLTELTQLESKEQLVWLQRNYGSVLISTKSLLVKLFKVFRHGGRQSGGDLHGSTPAKAIAKKLQPGLDFSFWRFASSVGRYYIQNYEWREISTSEMLGFVSDMNELMRELIELARLGSEERNYGRVLRSSKFLLARLLKVFRPSIPLREMIEILQEEAVEGDLLRDCLEVGGNDLKGLIQGLKDIALQYSSTT